MADRYFLLLEFEKVLPYSGKPAKVLHKVGPFSTPGAARECHRAVYPNTKGEVFYHEFDVL